MSISAYQVSYQNKADSTLYQVCPGWSELVVVWQLQPGRLACNLDRLPSPEGMVALINRCPSGLVARVLSEPLARALQFPYFALLGM